VTGIYLSVNNANISVTQVRCDDDGRLGPKHVVKGRSDGNICIFDGIILCITNFSHIYLLMIYKGMKGNM
jgi:hypothetical protein